MDSTGSISAVYYMAGGCLAVAGILGCLLRKKNQDRDNSSLQAFSCYNSQNLDIETVKVVETAGM